MRKWQLILAIALTGLGLARGPIAASAQGLPGGFVYLRDIDPTIIQDIRYAGSNNFVGRPLAGYQAAECVVKREVAMALRRIQDLLAPQKLSLKMFDCYRPQRAVAQFVRWAQRIDDLKRKREFYPDLDKRDLFKEGYIAERSGHSRGSPVDATLVRRADGRELDMGSPFDFFSPKSWPADTSVSAQAQQNRALLAAAMTRGGFRPYDKEWWHFTLIDEPFPDTYFDFPVR
jgi:zinc D-Ala-D-Ala dipeptidase